MGQVELGDSPPVGQGPFENVSDPRKKLDRGVVQRSFQVFRMLTGQEDS
jgi:hypothetical protein